MVTLTTERLVLRPFRRSDVKEFTRLAGDWDVASMTSDIPHPLSEHQALGCQGDHVAAGEVCRSWSDGRPSARRRKPHIISQTLIVAQAPPGRWRYCAVALGVGLTET